MNSLEMAALINALMTLRSQDQHRQLYPDLEMPDLSVRGLARAAAALGAFALLERAA